MKAVAKLTIRIRALREHRVVFDSGLAVYGISAGRFNEAV
jgi:hypothetical protein